ncbi:MAG: hypothetical protein IJN86_06430 [Clostridia bacterium]|nr:hypothetical protein [Clostridia bacterium]
MDEKRDFLMDDACDCEDDCLNLSLEDATDEDLSRLWDEADDDDFDICASESKCDKKKCIITAIIIGAAIALTAVIIYKLLKKSKKED